MELTKEELAFLAKLLSQIETDEARALRDKIFAFQKELDPEDFVNDPITLIKDYRIQLSALMKEMRQYPHDSAQGDVLSKKAEMVIQKISDLEKRIQEGK